MEANKMMMSVKEAGHYMAEQLGISYGTWMTNFRPHIKFIQLGKQAKRVDKRILDKFLADIKSGKWKPKVT